MVDFTASPRTPTDGSFVDSAHGDKLSLLTGVFGPNASGKTNLLKALSFVSFFIHGSYKHLEPEEEIPVDRFACSEPDEEPATFELEFEGKGRRFLYSLSVTPQKVNEEILKRYLPETGQFRQILVRKFAKDGSLHLRSFEEFTEVQLLRKALTDRPNASMLAAGVQAGRKEFQHVLDSLGQVATNVGRRGKRDLPAEGLTTDIFRCSEFFHKHPEHHDALRELLTAADIGIVDFKIEPVRLQTEKDDARESFLVFFQHSGPKGIFSLPAHQESSGTRRLFMLFEAFIRVLTSGDIAAIDEMESDLHPHLIPTILSLFTDPEINKKEAQLFFTCHHVEMLNHLQKEQIYLVEKREDCVSEAFRLDSLRGVRREENFFANYNSGRYGAIPEPEVVAF
ncbi:AAA family ATPase [Puniceicoccus vermicola]|uniref:ATP-binding protein n=1 Tax=Puniceicoccus vermicola TaxID=388746 RepID=A0A7X1B1X5_9BACT|nr:ATP-binding protein [Puniceicoccus vermicola]